MKRNEKDILDTFATSNTQIDPKFRASLKKQVARAPKGATKTHRSRYVWASAAFAVVLVALAITGLQRPDTKHPLASPQKVSAAELLRRSDIASKKFDFNKYNYFEFHTSERTGPGLNHLRCTVDEDRNFSETSTGDNYLFRAHDGGVEAFYAANTLNGKATAGLSVYDETSKVMLPDDIIDRNTNLDAVLDMSNIDGSGITNNVIVDKNGEPVVDDRVAPTKLSNAMVYEFYAKTNPKSAASIQNQQAGCFDSMITHVIIDADTSLLLSQESFLGEIDSANLIQSNRFNYVNENVSANDAIARLTAAGFNKDTASREFHPDSDGTGADPF
jgi:hypothetical protein